MAYSVEAIVITGLVGAVGLGIGLTFVLHDWRIDQALLRRLAQGLDAVRKGARLEGRFRRWHFSVVYGRQPHNSLSGLRVMLHTPMPVEIVVERKSGMQTLARSAGLVERAMTGDAAFDQDFFVLAPEGALSRCQMTTPERLHHIRQLFDSGVSRLDYSTEHQAVVAEWAPFRGGQDWTGTQITTALEHLGALAEPLPQHAVAAQVTTPRVEVAQFLPAYMLVLVLFSFGTLLALAFEQHYPPVDRGGLFGFSLGLSVPAFLLFTYGTRRALRRNMEGYRYWIPLVLLGAVAFPVAGYAAAVYWNGAGTDVLAASSVQRGALGFAWTNRP